MDYPVLSLRPAALVLTDTKRKGIPSPFYMLMNLNPVPVKTHHNLKNEMDSFNLYKYDPVDHIEGITPVLIMATSSEKANGFLTLILSNRGWDSQTSYTMTEVKEVTEGMFLIIR